MFDVVTNTNTVRIKVYKVRQDYTATLERWESEYSDGERFLTYFIVYSSLTAYTRSRATSESLNNTHSVFLIDNPFGATSSSHLLQSLAEITKKFNLQLLCFSDLKQSFITNVFNLIYQLSLKHTTYSNKSHLMIDGVDRNENAVSNKVLDHIFLKQDFQDSNQLSFL